MAERWVNAVIELLVPLNVSPSDSAELKLDAAERKAEEILDYLEPIVSTELVAQITWEDAGDA